MCRFLLLLAFLGAEAYSTQPPPAMDPAVIGNPNQQPISEGDKGPAVVRAQILLDRAHFSCGAIDGNFGSNLQKTVTAYQNDRHLPATGDVDAATWNSLNADQAPVLISYTITADDEKGPFVQIPNDMMKQAELPAMDYTSPLQELSERFHASQDLMQALNPGADFNKVGQQLTVPNATTMPPGEAAAIYVSKSESSVRAVGPDGKLLAFYVATIGSDHDPLPIGNWKVEWIKRDPVFHYDSKLFWDAKHPDQKADIKPGPNNPVGVVWIDLSKEHYGIHGTPDPSLIGHTMSHGCIRLTNWDASELANMVKPGTPAILQE
ncbi:MAG TPA: L,D-transpeptidase [Bryobacteraceae bacterium]|nr:L,D-transpeptidase [Bryobacteraceae bacterium]